MGEKIRLKRLVLDTNVVISALLFTGSSNPLVEFWQSGVIHLLASAAIVKEYARVLAYPKFELSEKEISDLLHDEILPHITPIAVKTVPAVIRADPSDDVFLACAATGHADAIISGDGHLLKLKTYQNIPILTVRACLDQLL